MEWFLRSIGVTEEVMKHLEHVQLAFQRPAALWLGLLILIPVGWLIYQRQRDNLRTVPRPFRITLTATRIFILFMLIVVLAGPFLKIDHKITQKSIVAVLFDTSKSMSLPAGPFASDEALALTAVAAGYELTDGTVSPDIRKALTRLHRDALAQSIVRTSKASFIEPLTEDYELRYYTFSNEPAALAFDPDGDAFVVGADDSASRIGDAINHVIDEAAGQEIAGILLLSDGQNTGGESMSQAARAAADAGAPIFAVPIGPVERLTDVSVIDVYTAGIATVGDTVQVHVTLETDGVDGQIITVELKDGDTLLDSKLATVQPDKQQQVELTFEAKVAGGRLLTVNVPHLPDEAEQLRSNNTDTTFVRISDDRLQVLLIDGRPRWDFRFLKNAIRRDNGLSGRAGSEPDVVVETEWRRLPDKERSAVLPVSAEEIAGYHTIIVGDASPAMLTPDFCKLLIDATRDAGVGLIIAAGTESMPHRYDKTFHDILPVRLRLDAAGLEAPVYDPFRLETTPNVHETMRLYDDAGRNQSIWAAMPPYFWCAAVERTKKNATVVAWNASVENSYGNMPLIAWHQIGEGKVMFVGTDSTWLWRQNVGDRFFYKFWGQSIRFVARGNDDEEEQDKPDTAVPEAVRDISGIEEELRHPNVNRSELELLASLTGGRVVEPAALGSIPPQLIHKSELKQLRHEATIWDNWLILLLLVLTYSIDVGIRRVMGLP